MCRNDDNTATKKNKKTTQDTTDVNSSSTKDELNHNESDDTTNKEDNNNSQQHIIMTTSKATENSQQRQQQRRRRRKRESDNDFQEERQKYLQSSTERNISDKVSSSKTNATTTTTSTSTSRAKQKHGNDKPSGGIESLIPSAIGLVILICGIMAKMGFRGRSSVAGIDLGTTNSVICVQAPSKGIGTIECINDPYTNSPIIPSVVSFLEKHEWKVGPSSKISSQLLPHPSTVIVGTAAKHRIDTHPLSTLYHAKRILGRSSNDPAIQTLQNEVEFSIHTPDTNADVESNNNNNHHHVYFTIPNSIEKIYPYHVGGYIINHLKNIMDVSLGHSNVRSAVICVPAKFNQIQRQETVLAFTLAGIKVVRIIDEPTSAALAYGLHKKDNVNYILVYDFGGGTLDVSILYVTNNFVDVMGTDGDDNLGGTDFDILIAQYLLTQQNGQSIINTVSSTLQSIIISSSKSTSTTITEEAIIQKCSESITKNTNKQSKVPHMEETKLLDDTIPLCTSSSFHTISEQLKIQLSQKYNTSVPEETIIASLQCYGLPSSTTTGTTAAAGSIETFNDFCISLLPYTISITLKEYNTISSELFIRSILPIQRLLNDLNIQSIDIDEIVMVGGTTRMPQIRSRVHTLMNHIQQLNTHIDPDLTVAYGAASIID